MAIHISLEEMGPTNVYKALKEDFVSNLTGSSVTEINIVTSLMPSAIFLWSALQSRYGVFETGGLLSWVLDTLLNIGVILLGLTVYSGRPLLLHACLVGYGLVVLLVGRSPPPPPTQRPQKSSKREKGSKGAQNAATTLPKQHYITMYRGAMMAITCIAILAVDFRVFPRRFAKVETWGTSVMDLGVGSFVFTGGIVSARPVLRRALAAAAGGSGEPRFRGLVRSLSGAAKLAVLGLVRLVSVKGLDYAEHVSEYGVHWNFFFTLALLGPAVEAIDLLCGSLVPAGGAGRQPRLVTASICVAVLVAAGYQAVLSNSSLQVFIFTAPRVDLISKNREGLASFAGYLAIFLAGRDIGLSVIRPATATEGAGGGWLSSAPGHLFVKGVFWTALFGLVSDHVPGFHPIGLTVSRRLANLPYVAWVCAYNTVQLFICALIERVSFGKQPVTGGSESEQSRSSRLLSRFNDNGMAVFLAANLLTGLVNMVVPTLEMGPGESVGILAAYSVGLIVVAANGHHLSLDRLFGVFSRQLNKVATSAKGKRQD